MQFPLAKLSRLLLIPFALLFFAATPLILGPGLTSPDPIGKYLNNAFPPPLGSGSQIGIRSYKLNLNFATTIGLFQAPQSNLFYVI